VEPQSRPGFEVTDEQEIRLRKPSIF